MVRLLLPLTILIGRGTRSVDSRRQLPPQRVRPVRVWDPQHERAEGAVALHAAP